MVGRNSRAAVKQVSRFSSLSASYTKCEPAYQEIRASIRSSPRVHSDETGWRIGGVNAWNHVLVGEQATLCEIARSHGFDVAAGVLGAESSGVLIHAGWAPDDRFTNATHQQCVLRRTHDLVEVATQRRGHELPRRASHSSVRREPQSLASLAINFSAIHSNFLAQKRRTAQPFPLFDPTR